jgi:hypothetical protein
MHHPKFKIQYRINPGTYRKPGPESRHKKQGHIWTFHSTQVVF